MPKLKWAGIIRGEAGALQQGVPLPGDAVKMAMPASMGEMMKKAAVFLPLPLTVLLGAMFVKTYLSGQVVVQPVFTVLGFCASVPAPAPRALARAPISKDCGGTYRPGSPSNGRGGAGLPSIGAGEVYLHVSAAHYSGNRAHCPVPLFPPGLDGLERLFLWVCCHGAGKSLSGSLQRISSAAADTPEMPDSVLGR